MQKFEKVNELVQPAAIQWGKLIAFINTLQRSIEIGIKLFQSDCIPLSLIYDL
jgi:hypothetical protein